MTSPPAPANIGLIDEPKLPACPAGATDASSTGNTCLLVYSDPKHAEHLNCVSLALSTIENHLRPAFNPVRLGLTVPSRQTYQKCVSRLVQDCVLGIVILDGFRHNVAYELGCLTGTCKPVVIIRSNRARVCAKALFTKGTRRNTTDATLQKLEDPDLLLSAHFSDCSGMHCGEFDPTAPEQAHNHIIAVLKAELEKAMPLVVKETQRLQKLAAGTQPTEATLHHLTELSRLYYAEPDAVDADEVLEHYRAVKEQAE